MLSFLCVESLQGPDNNLSLKSRVVINFDEPMLAIRSSIFGSGYGSLMVNLFSFL